MEMMLGEAGPVVAVLVHVLHLLGQIAEHPLVEIGPLAGHAFLDFFFGAERRQIERANFHNTLLQIAAPRPGKTIAAGLLMF